MNRARLRTLRTSVLALSASLVLASCSLGGGDDDAKAEDAGGTVVIASHESFTLPEDLVKEFEDETGIKIEVRAAGDAGTLATKLSLTSDNPIGDVAFGIDNTFASRPLKAGAFAENEPENAGPDAFQLPEGSDRLTAIDHGSVCVNVDTAWFEKKGQEPPQSLPELAEPAYRDLFVLPGASTSSPGMAFFLATVAQFGEGWPAYWIHLLDNGAKVVDGWEDAYYGDFTAGSEKGKRPIVVSYDSSPAFTVKDGTSTTAALLDTCFRQVEYAGVLEGADNPEGAKAVIDWLLTDEVQSQIPELMYMFPVQQSAEIPDDWAEHATPAPNPLSIAPEEIAENREQWLTQWTELVSR